MPKAYRTWRASGSHCGTHGTCSAQNSEEVFVVTAHRRSFSLLAVLAVICCVPALSQVVGEGMTAAPNVGTLASPAPPTPGSSQGGGDLPDDPLPQAFDESEAGGVAVPEVTPADTAESAAAGCNIPQTERDAFRAQWGLDSERQGMRTRLREAARNRPRTTERDRRGAPRKAWPQWRFYRHDSLDRMLYWPESAMPDRHGPPAFQPWKRDRLRPEVRIPWEAPSRDLLPDRSEYSGPWPWEEDPAGTPPADPGGREGIRHL